MWYDIRGKISRENLRFPGLNYQSLFSVTSLKPDNFRPGKPFFTMSWYYSCPLLSPYTQIPIRQVKHGYLSEAGGLAPISLSGDSALVFDDDLLSRNQAISG
jgi:hypothetical protein